MLKESLFVFLIIGMRESRGQAAGICVWFPYHNIILYVWLLGDFLFYSASSDAICKKDVQR